MIKIEKKLYPEILKAITFSIAATSFLSASFNEPFTGNVKIALTGLIILFYILLTIWGETKYQAHYKFKQGSKKETKFFQKWYSQGGVLKLFCNDVVWLEGREEIIKVLENKGNQLHCYLRYPDHEIATRLKNKGATIYRIKKTIISRHSLSTLETYGDLSVIVRNKDKDTESRIAVEEFRDHVVIYNLAEDLLDDCYDEINPN